MTTEMLLSAVGNIDDDILDRAAEKRAKVRRPLSFKTKSAVRIAIAAAAVIILTFGIVMTSVAKGDVLPPSRFGIGEFWPGDVTWTLEQAYETADAVCLVTVGNWLGDNGTGTFFDAHVEKSYKGELPSDIVIYQLGSSLYTDPDFPLFIHGDRMLVFANKELIPDNLGLGESYSVYKNALMLAAVAEDGTEYAYDYNRELSYFTVYDSDVRLKNYAADENLMEELHEDLERQDPVYYELIRSHEGFYNWQCEMWGADAPEVAIHAPYVYSLADLEAFFATR